MEQIIIKLAEGLGIPLGVIFAGVIGFLLWRTTSKIHTRVEILGPAVEEIKADVKELKEGKMWKETCDERHGAMDKIIDNHETRIHELETK